MGLRYNNTTLSDTVEIMRIKHRHPVRVEAMKLEMQGQNSDDILLGATGFVGSNVAKQGQYGIRVGSRTVGEARNKTCRRVVCSAAPGSMVFANRNPESDASAVDSIIDLLESIESREFVLISTIGVFTDFDKPLDETRSDFETSLAYGVNRRRLEEYCLARNGTVLRLPALFGSGLKKNFLYDLMNPTPSFFPEATWYETISNLDNAEREVLEGIYKSDEKGFRHLDRENLNQLPNRKQLEQTLIDIGRSALSFHNPETEYQFYNIDNLQSHIDLALEAGIDVLHLPTEPIRTRDVYAHVKGSEMPSNSTRLHKEDMRTQHDHLFPNGGGGYISNKEHVLDEILEFWAHHD